MKDRNLAMKDRNLAIKDRNLAMGHHSIGTTRTSDVSREKERARLA
jgi:hypothetical protein